MNREDQIIVCYVYYERFTEVYGESSHHLIIIGYRLYSCNHHAVMMMPEKSDLLSSVGSAPVELVLFLAQDPNPQSKTSHSNDAKEHQLVRPLSGYVRKNCLSFHYKTV